MIHSTSLIRPFLASTLVACAGTLALTWPGALHATGEDEGAEAANEARLPEGATRIDGLVASTEIVADEKGKRVRLHLVAHNPTQESQMAKLAIVVERREINPMARSSPPGEVSFSEQAHVIVPPGERFEKDVYVPQELADAILRSRAASVEEAAPDEGATDAPFTDFQAYVMAPEGTAVATG